MDKVGFAETQNVNAHRDLVKKHKLIKEKFGFDWMKVSWSDLTKPLYSGLAARLYLSNEQAPIPKDLIPQAKYWKNHYNTKAGSGTWQKFRDDVEALEKGTAIVTYRVIF